MSARQDKREAPTSSTDVLIKLCNSIVHFSLMSGILCVGFPGILLKAKLIIYEKGRLYMPAVCLIHLFLMKSFAVVTR